MSASDLSGRLLAPVIAFAAGGPFVEQRVHGLPAAMRFSLRTMISGAFQARAGASTPVVAVDHAPVENRSDRWWRSGPARPAATSGRSSGGSTGSTSMIIQSGLMFEALKPSSHLQPAWRTS